MATCEATLSKKCERKETAERRAAEIERLTEEGGLQAAEIEALRRANAHGGGPHAPPADRTLSGKAEAARKKRSSRAKRHSHAKSNRLPRRPKRGA